MPINPPKVHFPLNVAPTFKREELLNVVTIRPMMKADCSEILGIEAASFGAFHWNADSFKMELQNSLAHYYIVEHTESKMPLGYAGVWIIANEGHITTIASHPELRGFGLGELLFTQLLAIAYRGKAETLTLEVRSCNYAAQNLYYKYGFHQVGKRPRYYQDNGEDALLMTTPFLGNAAQVETASMQVDHFMGRYANPQWPSGHVFSKTPKASIIKTYTPVG